jgi:heterodisulfide reductase subunit C2
MSNNNKTKLDPMFKYKVADKPGGETVKACYSCGVCTASCPVNEVHEDFNPRKLIRMVLLGDKEEIFSSDIIWYCMLCERCYANCPQKVNFAYITRALRDISIEEGITDKSFASVIEKVDFSIADLRKKLITKILKNKNDISKIDISNTIKSILDSVE